MTDNLAGIDLSDKVDESPIVDVLPLVPMTKGRRVQKMMVMYATMVAVSTIAIFLLEHATILNAFRTALVAAIGKTLAANWVSGLFD